MGKKEKEAATPGQENAPEQENTPEQELGFSLASWSLDLSDLRSGRKLTRSSEFASDLASAPWRKSGIRKDAIRSLITLEGGGIQLIAAADYMLGLGTLLTMDGPNRASQIAVARACAESAAQVIWLRESGIGWQERLSRTLAVTRATLYQDMKTWKLSSEKDQEWKQDLDAKSAELDDLEQRLGLQEYRQRLPYSTALVARAFGVDPEEGGSWLYRSLSGPVHSSISGLLQTAFVYEDPAKYEEQVGFVILALLVPTIGLFEEAYLGEFMYNGWELDELISSSREIRTWLKPYKKFLPLLGPTERHIERSPPTT